jgi:hypothetical protein
MRPHVVHGWDGLPRLGDRYGPIYTPGARIRARDEECSRDGEPGAAALREEAAEAVEVVRERHE